MQNGLRHTYIHVATTTTYETPEQIEAFKTEFSAICDRCTYGFTNMDIIEIQKLPEQARAKILALREKSSLTRQRPTCTPLLGSLSIDWTGKIVACCSDNNESMVIGDVMSEGLSKAYDSSRLREIRTLIFRGEYTKLKACRNCYVTMPLLSKNTMEK